MPPRRCNAFHVKQAHGLVLRARVAQLVMRVLGLPPMRPAAQGAMLGRIPLDLVLVV